MLALDLLGPRGISRSVPEKNTFPPGQVKCSGCFGVQTSLMLFRPKFSMAIWIKHEKVVATT